MPPCCCVGLEAATSVYFDLKSIQNLTCGNQGFPEKPEPAFLKLAEGALCLPVSDRG